MPHALLGRIEPPSACVNASKQKPKQKQADRGRIAYITKKDIETLGAVASPRMGRRSLNFEAPPQPAPVVDTRTRDARHH